MGHPVSSCRAGVFKRQAWLGQRGTRIAGYNGSTDDNEWNADLRAEGVLL
jgi:hypothetical protein